MAGKILALVAAAGIVGASVPARAALCPDCRDRLLVDSVGKCESCGAATTSGALRLCPKCSARQNRCELCGKSLDGWRSPGDTQPSPPQAPGEKATTGQLDGNQPPAAGSPVAPPAGTSGPAAEKPGPETPGGPTPIERLPQGKPWPNAPAAPLPQPIDIRRPGSYNFGKWQYRLDIANPGTRGEGRWGSLWYDGQKLPRGAINDYYRTPWGPIYWVDVPATPWGLHGWMPVPLGQNNRQGRPLAVPAALAAPGKPEPPSNQKTLEVGKADSGRRARLYIGNILVVRLPANPGTGYQWQLGPTSSPTVRLMAEPQFVASPAPPGVMGASGTYVFMLQAVRPGTGIVRLVYARPWERDRTAADTFSLAVDVLPGAVSGPGRTAALPAGAVGGPSGPNSAPRGN